MNEAAGKLSRTITVRNLGLQEYEPLWRAMQRFTDTRDSDTTDEIWFTEHPPVFTLGLNASPEHLLQTGDIPVVQTDRGGQVTYHGPGQIVGYLMFDIRRLGVSVRGLVSGIEQAVVNTLASYGIEGAPRADAPGVYVGGAKIAALGLRIRRGCSYHGLSLNVAMDVEPFARINPCGLLGMEVTQISELVSEVDGPAGLEEVKRVLLQALADVYGINLHRSDTPDS